VSTRPPAHANEARELVRAGALGRVVFCRASNPQWLKFARDIRLENGLIAELTPGEAGIDPAAVVLGTDATLVVDRKGCHLLP
jgi:predicted dehydrogenase